MESALLALLLLVSAILIDRESILLFVFTIVVMCITLVLGVVLGSAVYCLSHQPWSIQVSVCLLLLSIFSAISKRYNDDD